MPSPDEAFLQVRTEMRRGRLDDALRDVQAACKKYHSDPQLAARFRVLNAHVLLLRGQYNDSLALLQPELPATLARTDIAVHRMLVLGLVHNYLQQFDPAGQDLSKAESLGVEINSSFLGEVSQARGMLFVNLQDYAKAESAFHKAIKIARQKDFPFLELVALGSLGNVAMKQEHFDEAVDRFKEVRDKAKILDSLTSISKANGNLGWSYTVLGDFDKAELSFKDARDTAERAGLIDDQIYWLGSLAGVYLQQHRSRDAYSTAQKAAELAKHHDDQETLTNCLNILSLAALATGNFEVAEKANREATEIESKGADQFGITYSLVIAGRIAAGHRDFPTAEAAFKKVIANLSGPTELRWEAHSRLAQVYAAQNRAPQAEREFKIAIDSIELARESLQSNELRLSFLSSAISFYDAYINFLMTQKKTLEALRIADRSRSLSIESSMADGAKKTSVTGTRFDPQNVASRRHAVLLFYWLGEEKSWLWVIAPVGITAVSLPAGDDLKTLVKSYNASFTEPRDPLETGNANGQKLYARLVEPAEKLIPKGFRTVILPDGGLNSLNFETLIVPACSEPCTGRRSSHASHYWIDDATVVTASSLSLLSRAGFYARPKSASLFAMGDALLASPDYPVLPEAGKEMAAIEKYFSADSRSLLSGKDAVSIAYLRGAPEKYSYLHFATHGTASRLVPLESAIILSPQGDSFKLYARDIVQHPVNAYLVTISACNGAGLTTYAGEGLVGLSWAFLHAGAHHVIAGLWEVSNASTPQVMDELYKGLAAGQDPAIALRNAKLTLLHSSGNYRRPFYWAPFLLYVGS